MAVLGILNKEPLAFLFWSIYLKNVMYLKNDPSNKTLEIIEFVA